MENNFVFRKRTYQNTEQKQGCSCNLYIARIPIYLTKTVVKRTSNAIFNMKKVCLSPCYIKVSECPFKQNNNMLKNMTVLSCTYFYNISLNVLRPTFSNIYNLPFLRSPNIGKIKVKFGRKV